MEQTTYYKPTQIAKIFGIKVETVRNMCHARGQKFAFRLVPKGRFYIEINKFREYLSHRQDLTRENRGW